MSDIKVSLVICHHKGRLIDKAIDSLMKSKGVELQIIVITSDETYQDFRVRVVLQNGGPAHKRNIGFRFAEHNLIAFFDDDVEVRPWAVYEMAKVLERDSHVGMVFGKLLNMEFPDRFDEAGSFLTTSGFLFARAESGTKDIGQFDQTECILAGKSASCMIRRKVFSEIGMFDASYEILAEETDLAWRVWLYGYQVLYVPSSVTLHAFNTKFKPADFYTPVRVYFNGSRNYLAMLLTNLGNYELIVPVITQFVVWFSAACLFFLTGKREASVNVFRGLGWVITHMPQILSKRKIVQRARKVTDKQLMPIIRRNPTIKYYINRFFSYISSGRHGGSYDPVKPSVVLTN